MFLPSSIPAGAVRTLEQNRVDEIVVIDYPGRAIGLIDVRILSRARILWAAWRAEGLAAR
ncbi:MAG: hypothetical protein ACI8QF_002580 [Limisphaerales bacterium]|jgi:hypothetical protein